MFLRQSDLQTVLADDNIEKGDTVHHFIQVTNGISLLTQNHFLCLSIRFSRILAFIFAAPEPCEPVI